MKFLTRSRLLLSLISLLALSGVQFQMLELQAKDGQGPSIPMAFAAAHDDFEKRVKAENRGDSAMERHLSDVANYKFSIHRENATLVIEAIPLPFRLGSLRGGGGKYIIDLETSEILSFEPYR